MNGRHIRKRCREGSAPGKEIGRAARFPCTFTDKARQLQFSFQRRLEESADRQGNAQAGQFDFRQAPFRDDFPSQERRAISAAAARLPSSARKGPSSGLPPVTARSRPFSVDVTRTEARALRDRPGATISASPGTALSISGTTRGHSETGTIS